MKIVIRSVAFRFPFDTKKPIGYLGAVALQYTQLLYEFFLLANLITLAIAAFLYAMSISNDMKHVLHSISVSSQTKKKRLKTIEQYNEFVEEITLVKP